MRQNDPISVSVQQNDAIKVLCPECGHENIAGARRCDKCEAKLTGVSATIKPLPEPPDPVEEMAGRQTAERSQPKQEDNPPVISPFPGKRSRPSRRVLIPIVVVIILLPIFIFFVRGGNPPPPPPDGLGEVTNSSGHNIGVNDGSFAPFDTGLPTDQLKQQAATKLKAGDSQAAVALWQQALARQSNDAEALIYIENQRVLASGKPYITLFVGVAFTFTATLPGDGSSESDLQGVYVAQHEFNTAQHGFQVRVLIANSGSNVPDTTAIAQQIVNIAHNDATVVGVVGWRYSSRALLAIPVLARAKIPLISSQATSDALTGISPYFFRVIAPNKEEVQLATPYIEKTLGFKHPVIFLDQQDSYSQNLAQDFSDQFKQDGYGTIQEEQFTTDATAPNEHFQALMQDALQKYHLDGFIFTGRSNADAGFFQDALPTSGPLKNINVFGGNGSYAAHKNSEGRWYFLAVAYHGASNTSIAQKFEQEYSADFNAHHQKAAGYYGYTLANDHVMVAYDATTVTLHALDTLYKSGKTKPTPQDLASELPHITGAHAFQGVSGQIAFGSDGNPINKALLILSVSGDGLIQLQSQ